MAFYLFGHNLWFSYSVYLLYRNGSKVKDTVKIKDVWCFIDHRKSQAWELSADKSGKRVFWVTYGQIFKDETRECGREREREYCATAKKGHAHCTTSPQSHILDLSVKLFVLHYHPRVHFFHLPVSSVNNKTSLIYFFGELPQTCKKKDWNMPTIRISSGKKVRPNLWRIAQNLHIIQLFDR